eukprot:gb/GECG01001207.1/.p1 GENE.gb/GECG01001207.1/~~gb/GECG01001207.1/.p1  ORF type:complete len:293 (+),score=44.89 gb/GECG01001207.1/:1-879(+)
MSGQEAYNGPSGHQFPRQNEGSSGGYPIPPPYQNQYGMANPSMPSAQFVTPNYHYQQNIMMPHQFQQPQAGIQMPPQMQHPRVFAPPPGMQQQPYGHMSTLAGQAYAAAAQQQQMQAQQAYLNGQQALAKYKNPAYFQRTEGSSGQYPVMQNLGRQPAVPSSGAASSSTPASSNGRQQETVQHRGDGQRFRNNQERRNRGNQEKTRKPSASGRGKATQNGKGSAQKKGFPKGLLELIPPKYQKMTAMVGSDPEDIKKWIESRRKHYPTSENIQKKVKQMRNGFVILLFRSFR